MFTPQERCGRNGETQAPAGEGAAAGSRLALRGAARAEANNKSDPIITVIDSRSDRDSSRSFNHIILAEEKTIRWFART